MHIAIADNKYSREIEIAEKVREILDSYRDKYIKNCYMDAASEYSMNDAYVQELIFKVVMQICNLSTYLYKENNLTKEAMDIKNKIKIVTEEGNKFLSEYRKRLQRVYNIAP